jgi:hypothetical protein
LWILHAASSHAYASWTVQPNVTVTAATVAFSTSTFSTSTVTLSSTSQTAVQAALAASCTS